VRNRWLTRGIGLLIVPSMALTMFCASSLLSAGIGRAGEPPSSATVKATTGAGLPAEFVYSVELSLTEGRKQISAIAEEVLVRVEPPAGIGDELMVQRVAASTAEAQYMNAKLEMEIAQISVREYKEGIAVTEKAVLDGEMQLAQSHAKQASENVKKQQERLAKIKEVSKGSAADLASEYMFEDQITAAELGRQRDLIQIEQVAARRKEFNELKKPMRTKELEAAAENAMSETLAKQAHWEMAKARVAKLMKLSKKVVSDSDKQILAAVREANDIETQLRGKLDHLDEKSAEIGARQKEIVDLANQFHAAVDRLAKLHGEDQARKDNAKYSAIRPRVDRVLKSAAKTAKK
jgi:hypothetical protein